MADFQVALAPGAAFQLLYESISSSGSWGEFVDSHTVTHPHGGELVVAVFEKYYMRAGNRVGLTVTIHNFSGVTEVHTTGCAGSEGVLFRFDWGAGDDFADMPRKVLAPYITRG